MLNFLKKNILPIGVDLGSDYLKMAQLSAEGDGVCLYAASCAERPADIEYGSAAWQKWVADSAATLLRKGNFKSKEVITAMPCDDVFIDQIKIPKTQSEELEKAAFAKVARSLPFDPDDAMIKYVPVEHDNGSDQIDVLVMAAERKLIERHLAIYEEAGLEVKGIGVWPLAIINSYVRFFGRRETDVEAAVMLMDIGANHSNIVICRDFNLLFARVIPIGFKQLGDYGDIEKLMGEMDASCRYYESSSGLTHIQRLIFLSGKNADKNICRKVADFAERMQIPAQIGDVLGAIEIAGSCRFKIDKNNCLIDWATAFGLSLGAITETRTNTTKLVQV